MMDPDFEENGFEYFNPDEDVYNSNYYMHSCDDQYFYDYDHYCSYFLYTRDGTEISDIEEEENDE